MKIRKIKLQNFKKFRSYEINVNDGLNILIGDNESGKSTILQAIDIVLNASSRKLETIGLDRIITKEVIEEFNINKSYEKLPELYIELYFDDTIEMSLEGKYNSDKIEAYGLSLKCKPNDDYSFEIKSIIESDSNSFPFEFYSISFTTFGGEPYNYYRSKHYLRHLFIDNTSVNTEYATNEYIKNIYSLLTSNITQIELQNKYREYKNNYIKNEFKIVNEKMDDGLSFSVKSGLKYSLETDLTIHEDGVPLEDRGKGKQCSIKTQFALNKQKENIDIILLEEPENHLSHISMHKLIKLIEQSASQIFISTHNDQICNRLDLENAFYLSSENAHNPISLNHLSNDARKYFMKSTNTNLLEFVLSKKVILVEGNAEYILFPTLAKQAGHSPLSEDHIHVISVGGISFKHFLELSKILNIKTSVIRDNDGLSKDECEAIYSDYTSETIKVFCDDNRKRSTFEICLYLDNKTICDTLFTNSHIKNTPQNYMLKNKTEAAFRLTEQEADNIRTPAYINEAIQWLKN